MELLATYQAPACLSPWQCTSIKSLVGFTLCRTVWLLVESISYFSRDMFCQIWHLQEIHATNCTRHMRKHIRVAYAERTNPVLVRTNSSSTYSTGEPSVMSKPIQVWFLSKSCQQRHQHQNQWLFLHFGKLPTGNRTDAKRPHTGHETIPSRHFQT